MRPNYPISDFHQKSLIQCHVVLSISPAWFLYLIHISVYSRFHAEQKANPDHRFTLSEDFAVVFAEAAGEIVVGGVFLRLFIANPGWVLRKPKEFLTELLERWCTMTSTNSPNVSVDIIVSFMFIRAASSGAALRNETDWKFYCSSRCCVINYLVRFENY